MPFDLPEEALFVLIFLLISFFNWIGEKVKKAKMDAANRRPSVRDFEEEPPDFPEPQTQYVPPRTQEADPMRQILESLGIPVEEERPPPPDVATPPPLESPSIPEIAEVAPQASEDTSWDFDQLSTEEQSHAFDHQPAKVEHAGKHPGRAARKLLSPQHAQTAFVLKEILDNPKCFDV